MLLLLLSLQIMLLFLSLSANDVHPASITQGFTTLNADTNVEIESHPSQDGAETLVV